MAHDLTQEERDFLEFEHWRWNYAGAKEQAIKDLFDLSATRYYQRLNALIDREAAYVADPVTVKRLRRLRETRSLRRAG